MQFMDHPMASWRFCGLANRSFFDDSIHRWQGRLTFVGMNSRRWRWAVPVVLGSVLQKLGQLQRVLANLLHGRQQEAIDGDVNHLLQEATGLEEVLVASILHQLGQFHTGVQVVVAVFRVYPKSVLLHVKWKKASKGKKSYILFKWLKTAYRPIKKTKWNSKEKCKGGFEHAVEGVRSVDWSPVSCPQDHILHPDSHFVCLFVCFFYAPSLNGGLLFMFRPTGFDKPLSAPLSKISFYNSIYPPAWSKSYSDHPFINHGISFCQPYCSNLASSANSNSSEFKRLWKIHRQWTKIRSIN